MKNRIGNRFLSLFLALALVIGLVSTTAFAAPGTGLTLGVTSDVKVSDGTPVDPDDYIEIEPTAGVDAAIWFVAGISVDQHDPEGVLQIAMDGLLFETLDSTNSGTNFVMNTLLGVPAWGYDLNDLSKDELTTLLEFMGEYQSVVKGAIDYVNKLSDVLGKVLVKMGGDADNITYSLVNGGYKDAGDGREAALSPVGTGMYALVAVDISNSDNMDYGYLVVTPKAADVKISSSADDKGHVYLRTYNGQPQDGITVTVNGNTVTENLKFMYIGMDTTADGYFREEAPTDAGVYAVVAAYLDNDGIKINEFGGAAKILVIKPAEASFNLTDKKVHYNGQQHFATVTGDYHYITVAKQTGGNGDVFVNVPGSMDDFETVASLIPSANISNKVLSALEGFDGDVRVSTVQAKLADYIQIVEDVDLYGEVLTAAEKAYNKANQELEGTIVKDYTNMVSEMVDSLEEQGYTFVDAAGLVGYVVMESGVSLGMDDVYAVLGALLSKADELGYVQDAETLLKTLAAIGGVEDTPAVKAAIKDVIDTFKTSVKAVSADVIAAVETQDPAVVKVAVVEALQGIEVFFDKEILPAAQAIVDEFDPNVTIYFEQNPVEMGVYDCYAVNVSANYMPAIRTAKLTILPDEKYVCWNMNTGVYYEQLEPALAEANNATVQMLKDYDCYFTSVTTGNTLDLNGCAVTSTYAIAFDGAHIVDSAEGEGMLVVGENALVLDEQNAMLPVYDGGAYRFGTVKFAFRQNGDYTGEGFALNAIAAPKMFAVELFKDGAADNNVQIVIRLTWTSLANDRVHTQDISFRDVVVEEVYSSNLGSQFEYTKMFQMIITGVDAVKDLKANVVLVSGTDVEIVSGKTLEIN